MSSGEEQACVTTSADEGHSNEPSREAHPPIIWRGIDLSSLLLPEEDAKFHLKTDEKLICVQQACLQQLKEQVRVIKQGLRAYRENPSREQGKSVDELCQDLQDFSAYMRESQATFKENLAKLAQHTE